MSGGIYAKLMKVKEQLDFVESKQVYFAVQGCCHGELDAIYAACAEHEQKTKRKIRFLICCGDFQAVRDNGEDLDSMAVPAKYRCLGDFHRYCGEHPSRVAPYLTIFIGGNHEASNFLMENYYGGFVAKNIYFMGMSGVIRVCGLRIAGLSGIFKGRDYTRPFPLPPYERDQNIIRSAYHVRAVEVAKLALITQPIDIFISHDWPVGVTKYGDEAQLLRYKPYFADDIAHNNLGNPYTLQLLQRLKPAYWFAAHLHCFFDAKVPHMELGSTDGRFDKTKVTRFIALDKCVHQRETKFIDFFTLAPQQHEATPEVSETPGQTNGTTGASEGVPKVMTDPEWMDIITFSHPHLRLGDPRPGNYFDEAHPVVATAAHSQRPRGTWLCAGPPAPHLVNVEFSSTAALMTAMGQSYCFRRGAMLKPHPRRLSAPQCPSVPPPLPPPPPTRACPPPTPPINDDDDLFVEDAAGE